MLFWRILTCHVAVYFQKATTHQKQTPYMKGQEIKLQTWLQHFSDTLGTGEVHKVIENHYIKN